MRMRTFWASAVTTAALALGLVTAPIQAAAVPTAGALASAPVVATAGPSQEIVGQLAAQLPAARAEAAAGRARLGLEDSALREAALNLIDPTQYECSTANPPVLDAVAAGIQDWTFEQRLAATYVLLFDLVMSEAVYLPTPGPYTFGAQGTFTTTATRTFRDLRNFWDIKSDDIQLVPAHGRMLLTPARVTKVFTTLYNQPADLSANTAAFIATQVNTAALKFGDHPIFTFNAYAHSAEGQEIPGLGIVPDKVVLGDGVLDGFNLVGLGDVTTQAILGHEFGHHVQYEDGLFQSDLPTPEATRRTELMADSFSAYFLTHVRGENMHWLRVEQFTRMFGQLGDCGFAAPSHHGTPNQRVRAALWGFELAETARAQGHILPSLTFASRFEQVLPDVVRPDATA